MIPWEIRKHFKPYPNTAYRRLIYDLYDGKCAYCDKEIELHDAHMDHMLAYYNGGHTTINNMCLSCERCNKAKGTDDWSHKYTKPNPVRLVEAYIRYVLDGHFKLVHLI